MLNSAELELGSVVSMVVAGLITSEDQRRNRSGGSSRRIYYLSLW
jgi:hypothetical protein